MYFFSFLDVRRNINLPVIVGSGVTSSNVTEYLDANALIVGSHLKLHGLWYNSLSPTRVENFMSKVHKYRDGNAKKQPETAPADQADMSSFNLTAQGEWRTSAFCSELQPSLVARLLLFDFVWTFKR